jgi:hypothetical protein
MSEPCDPGLLATLRQDLVPWLEANLAIPAQHLDLMAVDPLVQELNAHCQPLFTIIVDREGYSPDFFAEMEAKGIAVLTYHKYAGPDWPAEEFAVHQVKLAGGEMVEMKLAERATSLNKQVHVREIRKLSEGGHQVATTESG